ncbi:MAG: polymerase subunit sigma-24 [Sphingobacteriales bacterium]|nr:polymerase subunit sigma-24 [Sphingobacteriales bacterium]
MTARLDENEIKLVIPGCIKKERASQQALYKYCYGYGMGICLRYSQNRSSALEILNSGFLKVFVNLEKYKNHIPFKAWLGRIMINTAIDHYRSELKFAHIQELSDEHDLGEVPVIESKLNYNDLLLLIQSLPNAYRTVFNLYAIDGYNHPEIASMLNISVGTSKSNLFKARKKLQELILMGNHDYPVVNKNNSTLNDELILRNGSK